MAMLMVATTAGAAPPTTCGQGDAYSQALCSYQQRQFPDAEARFRAIVDSDVVAPHTLKAMYFLARTLMKTGRFAEAANLFVRIYETDPPFYDAWNCDFLLGECRRAMGKG
ncbi:MAG: tetratricopeptide repeat protein [Thermoanaerobaculia bacterium]